MPNWVTNRILVRGASDSLDEFKELVQSSEEWFSCNSVLPLPEELQDVGSPVRIVSQEEYDTYEEPEDLKKLGISMGRPITQQMADSYQSTYGADNWYEWATHYWGCKWDARDVVFDFSWRTHVKDRGYLIYEFQTPWSPPEPIYEILRDKFPALEIKWDYADESYNFIGRFETNEHIGWVTRDDVIEFNRKAPPNFSPLEWWEEWEEDEESPSEKVSDVLHKITTQQWVTNKSGMEEIERSS